MNWLILIHVLSAIIGVGPTFFGHALLRKNQSLPQLRQSFSVAKHLEYFPKIGGTIALVTGLCLVIFGHYGSFMQLWLIGALIVYLYIQVMVIAFYGRAVKELGDWISHPEHAELTELPAPQQRLFHKVNRLYWAASAGGVLLFVLMIMKPAVQV